MTDDSHIVEMQEIYNKLIYDTIIQLYAKSMSIVDEEQALGLIISSLSTNLGIILAQLSDESRLAYFDASTKIINASKSLKIKLIENGSSVQFSSIFYGKYVRSHYWKKEGIDIFAPVFTVKDLIKQLSTDYKKQIIDKVSAMMKFEKYKNAIGAKENFILAKGTEEGIMLQPIPDNFDQFLERLNRFLKEVVKEINFYSVGKKEG